MSGPTLVVEDGTNVTGANTYISQAAALTYFTNRGDQVFTGASAVNQATALVRAAQGMDAWLTGRWYGRRANQVQALDWPRREIRDSDGYHIPSNSIPARLQAAQCEVAKIELVMPFIQAKVDRYDAVQTEAAGPVSITFKPIAPSITYWPQVIALLMDYAAIGVMPINVIIGITERERHLMHRERDGVFGGSMNPFDFPRYFELIKDPSFGSDFGPFGG